MTDGWSSEPEVGGCRVGARSASAPGVCARLVLPPFWTCKAASAAAERRSSHKLVFVKKERKKMMKKAAVKEQSRDGPAVHGKRVTFTYTLCPAGGDIGL